jgi:hypothetical protein
MMMRMLEAGGMDVLTDGLRAADKDNPRGYYEFERVKQIEQDASWLDEAEGRVVKMVSQLLQYLPLGRAYKVIFMRREVEEILASQHEMLVRRGEATDRVSDERLAALFCKHVAHVEAWLSERPSFDVITVSYNDVLDNPLEEAQRINQFFGGTLDAKAMAAVVDPTLYRQRG